MNKIQWLNSNVNDPDIIRFRIKFINKNMNGLLPLYGKEKENLESYAKKYHISKYEMFSLRNTFKIHKEISNFKYFDENLIKDRFKNLLTKNKISYADIRSYLKSIEISIRSILKIVCRMPEYQKLSTENQSYINRIENAVSKENSNIAIRSAKFEKQLENFLEKYNLEFLTENQIKEKSLSNLTPDFLFEKPINISVNNSDHEIHWIDAKDFQLVRFPFVINSLKKQAKKYNNEFGHGAFVFHYGMDSSVVIPDTLLLDGSFIFSKNN